MSGRDRRKRDEQRRQNRLRSQPLLRLKQAKANLASLKTTEIGEHRHPAEVIKAAYAAEMKRHPSLVRIIDVPVGHPARTLEGQDLLNCFGYADCQCITWDSGREDDDYGYGDVADGGRMVAARDACGKLVTFVFLNEKQLPPEQAEAAFTRLCALYHETGHVDDVEQRVNFRNGCVDLAAAETYAHHHACKRLIDGGYRITLALYLASMIRQQLESRFRLVRKAAEVFTASPQYKQYVQFAGAHFANLASQPT